MTPPPAKPLTPDWQTIDSAPVDGTEFLGYWDNDDMHVVCIRDGECQRSMDPVLWAMPTHWMPLPSPPKFIQKTLGDVT